MTHCVNTACMNVTRIPVRLCAICMFLTFGVHAQQSWPQSSTLNRTNVAHGLIQPVQRAGSVSALDNGPVQSVGNVDPLTPVAPLPTTPQPPSAGGDTTSVIRLEPRSPIRGNFSRAISK